MDTTVRKRVLERLGLSDLKSVRENLSPARLVEESIRRGEATLSDSGALVAETGVRTGRSPADRFIIETAVTRERVTWDKVNQPFPSENFGRILDRAADFLRNLDEVYVVDSYAGADPRYRLNVQIVTEWAWHALFARQLFRRPTREELEDFEPNWTVISVPGFEADPERDGTNSETFIGLDFERRVVLVCASGYAGEIKKSIFTVLNFVLPVEHGVLPMHCSANVGEADDVALFFGLSGTGKTTISTDEKRRLIGDDEHGWSEDGVFNFEGGSYAKTIDLSPEKEPQIYSAIRFGAVLENVVMDEDTREEDYSDASRTENTRVAYPLDYIENSVPEGRAAHPGTIIFLTADAFGALPPISILTPEQAEYYFLSGYTAKLAGTEADMETEAEATFSTCFGAPFLPLPPTRYSSMLSEKIRRHSVRCYMVNTGWSGGPYGVGERIDLPHTREMVRAAIAGRLEGVETHADPVFGLNIPASVPGVPDGILDPRETWPDKSAYDEQAKKLADLFKENFEKFEGEVEEEVRRAGPQ
ncbi:MAG: phosphoenolpyruvate carboxykinase (ATP) [Actinomycetota bacterium]|nr:phosphoenolpyruvate carboxykinase (ATP) [Actinomycetota bacterium]